MTANIHASSSRKIYLLSDFHLGAPNYSASLEREKKVVAFLQSIEDSAAAVFIVFCWINSAFQKLTQTLI